MTTGARITRPNSTCCSFAAENGSASSPPRAGCHGHGFGLNNPGDFSNLRRVLKTALGRGLAELMPPAPPGESASRLAVKSPSHPPIAPGLAALLKGKSGPDSRPSAISQPTTAGIVPELGLIAGSLLLADLWLVAVTAWRIWGNDTPLRSLEMAGYGAGLVLGAWLGCLASWMVLRKK